MFNYANLTFYLKKNDITFIYIHQQQNFFIRYDIYDIPELDFQKCHLAHFSFILEHNIV